MKTFLKVLGIIIALLIVAVIVIPFFIDANMFRPKLESELTDALGRQVKVGNLSLALWSGSVAADNISIADDPKFSNAPFVQAKSLKVGVELLPLIFSKTLNIRHITLDQPQISLVKSENGDRWNFSSLGGKNPSAPAQPSGASSNPGKGAAQKSANTSKPSAQETAPAEKSSSSEKSSSNAMNLSVGKLNVLHGRVNVSRADSTEPKRVYNEVNIAVKNFSFNSSFPFDMTANLPSGGTMKLTGTLKK